jgi:hypothetical protein
MSKESGKSDNRGKLNELATMILHPAENMV